VDDAGRVLTPCIHWTDRRAPDETERLFAEVGERLVAVSGVLPIPGLVLPNLAWTRRHRPDVWRAARHALQPKDYLAYRLTGDVGTDRGSPTRRLLNDWRTWDWSPELCAAAGIELELLPPVRYDSWQVRGELGAAAAAALGLAPGTAFVAGGGDDQSATFGVGVVEPGELSIGTGSSTSWRLVAAETAPDPTGLIGVAPHVVPGRVIGEMVAVGTGTSFRWFREAFGAGASYEELIAEAAGVEPGASGLLAFPYPEGASLPEQDARVRAAFLGIDAAHRRPHFARAILEAIAYLYPALLGLVEERGHAVGAITLSDGEARSATWNRIKADVLGRPLTPALVAEAPALGAAMLAGLATGAFADAPSAVAALVERGAPVEPSPERHARYVELRAGWERARRHVFASASSA
jgi:sugar (pentulose or hexulose) kinase